MHFPPLLLLQNLSTCRSWWSAPFLWHLWSLARWWPCTVVRVYGPNSQHSSRSAFPCVAAKARPSPWSWLQGRHPATCVHRRASPAQLPPAPAVLVGAAHCAASLWADLMLWDSNSPRSSSCWPQPRPFPPRCPWHQLNPYCLLHLHLHTHLHSACRAAFLMCTHTNMATIRTSTQPRAPTSSCPSSTSSPCSQSHLVGVKALLTSARADLELRYQEQDTGATVNLCDTISLAWTGILYAVMLLLNKINSSHTLCWHTELQRVWLMLKSCWNWQEWDRHITTEESTTFFDWNSCQRKHLLINYIQCMHFHCVFVL